MVLCGLLASVAVIAYDGWGRVLWVATFILLGVAEWRSYRYRVTLLKADLTRTRERQREDLNRD